MKATELQEMQDYWKGKYPDIEVTLYFNEDNKKYCGKMLSSSYSCYLQAETVGELISQAEDFLRKVNKLCAT